MSEYLRFVELSTPNRKTPIVEVRSRSSNALLGQIKWYGAWRQFCFWPEPATIFNIGCMTDIEAEIAALRNERAVKTVIESKECERVTKRTSGPTADSGLHRAERVSNPRS
jgi:hypothetical protein